MLFQLFEGANDWQVTRETLNSAGLSKGASEFAYELAQGAWQKRFEIEQYIGMFASGWQYDRLFSVDRLLLHLAMYELKYRTETPPAIVINEAIELARQYGTAESPAFINAVLDNFRRKVLEENLPEYQPSEEAIRASEARAAAKTAPVAELPEVEEVPAPPAMPITEQFKSRTFRKIRKDERTEDDAILPEPEEDEEERRFDDRPRFDRDFDRDRKPFGDKNFDRKPSDRKFGDKNFDRKSSGDRKFSDKNFDKKPSGDRKFGDKNFDKKPSDRKFGDKKQSFGNDKKFDKKQGFGGDKKFDKKQNFGNDKKSGRKPFPRDRKPYDKKD
jgi:N utilization substance protein B